MRPLILLAWLLGLGLTVNHPPLPCPLTASSTAPTGAGRPLSEPGVRGMGMDGDRSDQNDAQRLEKLLLEGLATPAEELSAEYLEQLRRDVREVIAKARPKHAMSET